MKKMLMIAPKFYNYHEIIKNGFEKAGFEVDYFDDRPDSSFMTKVLVRINKRLIAGKINRYFKRILSTIQNIKYDVVFVLYGQSFTKKMIDKLREKQKSARFIFYMYDPISSQPDRLEFSKAFDDCYSFDSEDCKRYVNFHLLPLFYSFKDFPKTVAEYDACFVSTMMPGKYQKSKAIIQQLEKANYKVYKFQFIQSKLVYRYFKLKSKDFRGSKSNEFSYKRISNKEANEIISKSKIVIDCQKDGQSGLTIRTFETLSANKKLITTNESIINYDFYKPENIYVFRGTIDFEDVFFKKEYVPLEEKIKEKYSINSWISKILSNYREV